MTAKIIGKKVILPDNSIMEGERKVDGITFTVASDYNGTDLSLLYAYANVKRADDSTDKITLTVEKNEQGDELFVYMPIEASITAVPGELQAHVSFESADGETVFMSERFTLQINPTPNAYQDYTDRTPNALYRLQTTMMTYITRMQELVDEVDEKISQIEMGGGSIGGDSTGGGSGGIIYDENNKLSADYVDGLSVVAKSGSYSDLTDKPDMTAYSTVSALNEFMAEMDRYHTPANVKYISMSMSTTDMIAKMNYNKEILSQYYVDGIGYRPVYIWVEETNSYYLAKSISFDGEQLDIFFNINANSYSITYNVETGSYGFGE